MTLELLNQVTAGMRPYPMEELGRIKTNLIKEGRPVYDFGTGDPLIPTWAPIRDAIVNAIPQISQYPSVKGTDALREAQWTYLGNRFNIKKSPEIALIPAQGTKEAIFNIGLCLVGRSGKKHVIYPDPGYPVYRASTLYAGGIPYPVRLTAENNMRIEPWTLPQEIQKSTAAIWINHPHNPTGSTVSLAYWQQLIDWCHKTDTILLSDDCYTDIYDTAFDQNPTSDLAKDKRPLTPLQLSSDRVLAFMSLSKRSGMTGYRSGMIAGDARIINSITQARANFGVGSPNFIQAGAAVAWADEAHVAERRKIFSHRLKLAYPYLEKLGLLTQLPKAAFYFWCTVPKGFKGDDVRFILALADEGIISSPSSWLSEGMTGYFRLAMVPDDEATLTAMEKLTSFVQKHS
jgi:succinyldiaminopimelate transaminase